MLHVSRLYVHPIKSCAGISVPEIELDTLGVVGDRRLVVVDERGCFVTQREDPRLAWVRPSFLSNAPEKGELAPQLRLESPHGAIDLGPAKGPDVPIEVWGDRCNARTHERGSAWLSTLFGAPYRLVELVEDRPVPPKYAPFPARIAFADAFPLLVISEASLRDLNARLEAPVGMERFRPNLVVEGGEPYLEDTMMEMRIGEILLRSVKPCARCVIVDVDPSTGDKGKEPLRTLATYRKVGSKVLFGQNALHDRPGAIRVGDRVY